MKKLVHFFILALFLSACNDAEVKELANENQDLKQTAEQQNETINELLSTFNQIQDNISEIKKREGILKIETGESTGEYDINSINEDIDMISDLMKRNEDLMNELQNQVNKSNTKNVELLKLVKNLQNQLKERNAEIASLNDELRERKIKIGQLYFSVDSLTFANKVSGKELEEKTDQLYEGYYAFGTSKELIEKNVLSKEGGLLGIGSKELLKDDFNNEYFSKIDIRKQTSFLIYAKKAELVTPHPKNSYEFKGKDGQVDSLVISKPDEFWKASRYMVIVTN